MKPTIPNLHLPSVVKPILVIAFLFRIHGLFYGLPFPYAVPDEFGHYLGALHILANKTLIIPYYQIIGSYITAPFIALTVLLLLIAGQFSSLFSIQQYLLLNPGSLLPIARLIAVIFALLNIYLVFLISSKLWNNKTASTLSSLFLTFSLLHVQLSQFARPWSLVIFFILLCLHFSIQFINNSKQHYLFFASISAFLAFGSHQSGIIAYLIIFLLALNQFRHNRKHLNPKQWIPSIFLLFTFPALFHFLRTKTASIGYPEQFDLLFTSPPQLAAFTNQTHQNIIFFINTFLHYDVAICIFGIIGIIMAPKIKFPIKTITLCLILLTFTSFYATARSLLPLTVFFSLFAGNGLIWLANQFSKAKLLILTLAFLPSLILSLRFNFLLHQPPTFDSLNTWLRQHTESEIYVAISDSGFSNLIPSLPASQIIRDKNPSYFQSAYQQLSSQNFHNVVYLDQLKNVGINPLDHLSSNPPQYIIDIYFQPRNRINLNTINKPYQKIVTFYPLPDFFQPLSYLVQNMVYPYPSKLLFSIQRPGPYIDIYESLTQI